MLVMIVSAKATHACVCYIDVTLRAREIADSLPAVAVGYGVPPDVPVVVLAEVVRVQGLQQAAHVGVLPVQVGRKNTSLGRKVREESSV